MSQVNSACANARANTSGSFVSGSGGSVGVPGDAGPPGVGVLVPGREPESGSGGVREAGPVSRP